MKKKLPVLKNDRVLVVGTTPDYVEWIRRACPDRGVFLTDPELRSRAKEPCPSPEEEILLQVDTEKARELGLTLESHVNQWGQTITGVACFDCESMETAAMIASDLSLAYPGLAAIRNSRDKYRCKKIWEQNNIPCPKTMPVNCLEDATGFMSRMDAGIVLKPFFGSGSELVFNCITKEDCKQAFKTIEKGLAERYAKPLFKKKSSLDYLMLAEELIEGTEFSCDFIVDNNTVTIVRTTRKIKRPGRPFGTILGYAVQAGLSCDKENRRLKSVLLNSAKALGIERGLCMVDFIIRDHEPILIEMTPRPGGDCLPFLLLEAGNLDIIKLTLDFAQKKPLDVNGKNEFKPHMAVRIFAHKDGIIKKIDSSRIECLPGVKKIYFTKKAGHKVTMPPQDYDSWLLGHVIVECFPDELVDKRMDKGMGGLSQGKCNDLCLELSRLITVEIGQE